MPRSRERTLRRELGEGLKRARLSRPMTARDLALRSGLDVSTVYGLERGRFFPSLTNLCRLAEVLKADVRIAVDLLPEAS